MAKTSKSSKSTRKAASKAPAKRTRKAKEPAPETTTEEAATTTAAKPNPTLPKPKKERAVRTDTPAYLVRRIICEHPDISIPECERLARREMPDIDRNTLRGLYQGAMGFLKVARSLGYTLAR